MLLQLVSATAVTHNTAEALLFEGLMDVWWARVCPADESVSMANPYSSSTTCLNRVIVS